MDFPPLQHLLDKMSDLDAEREELDLKKNDPEPDAPNGSSATFKGKKCPKKELT